MGEIFERATPPTTLKWTGERLTTETTGQVEIEHLHRYFFARALCRGLDVLDIASGEGYGSALLAQVANSVVGVDIARDSVKHANAAYSAPNLAFLQGDARKVPCPDDAFDVVVSFETLEHFYEHAQFVAEVRRVLRPGGMLIISSPERDVYSPAGGIPNPYHVHELTHFEFGGLLRSNFHHVAIYGQRPLLGSALMPEEFQSAVGQLLTFERRDNRLFEASIGLPRPIYLVAVASDKVLRPSAGSLYIETSGVEALFAASAAAKQEVQSLTERLTREGEYAQRVQIELNQRDAQLAAQVADAQELRRQLAKKDERYAALVDAHSALLKRRADRYARHEAAYRAELERRAELLARQEAAWRAELECQVELLRQQNESEGDALRARLAVAEDQLRAILASSSWRLTGPLRGIAARHPATIANLHNFLARHPVMRRVVGRSARKVWRAMTMRSIRNPGLPQPENPFEPRQSAIELARSEPSATSLGLTFKQKAISPLAPSPAPALPRGRGRRALCVGHVLPYPPRAGNEYRIHRLLSWLASQDWNLLVVICPLAHEMPSEQQLAGAAAVYPSLIVCDHQGTLFHNLSSDSQVLNAVRPDRTADIPALLGETDGDDPARARLLGLQRAFCPDALAELLLHLQESYRPDLLVAEYVFMTRPFTLLNPNITTVVDTIDVFSTKAAKVEQYGVSDGLAISETEEAMLLRRADVLIGIQPEEARKLAKLAPDRKVISVGVDFPVLEPDRAVRPTATVLLVASANPMNVKGVHDFLSFAWPIVQRDAPEADFLIVGAVGESVDHVPDRVRIVGRVENLRPLYASARVVINPTIAGTGLKIKTIEAICHFRPVVCWPSGVDGVAPEARPFCHVATDWFNFACQVVRLLKKDDEALALEHEREALARAFSPERVYAPLEEVLHEI